MALVEFDPFAARDDIPHDQFAELRRTCPVAPTPTGWYLARRDDVHEATRAVDVFVSSFREPGVVVPEEDKLVSEIAEPRHGKVRRIINATVAHHRSMRAEPFIRDLCSEYLQPAELPAQHDASPNETRLSSVIPRPGSPPFGTSRAKRYGPAGGYTGQFGVSAGHGSMSVLDTTRPSPSM